MGEFLWLIIFGLFGYYYFKKKQIRRVQKKVNHNKCAYCGVWLKKQPGTHGVVYATTCSRCGRVQPWGS